MMTCLKQYAKTPRLLEQVLLQLPHFIVHYMDDAYHLTLEGTRYMDKTHHQNIFVVLFSLVYDKNKAYNVINIQRSTP